MSRNTELEEKVAQMEKAAKIQRDVAAVINELSPHATSKRAFSLKSRNISMIEMSLERF